MGRCVVLASMLISCCIYGLHLGVVCFLSEISWKTTFLGAIGFLSFGSEIGACVYSRSFTTTGLDLWWSCACLHSFCALFVCVTVLPCLECLVSFIFSFPLALTIFPVPLLQRFLSSEWEGFDEVISFRIDSSKVYHCLYTGQMWVFVCVPIFSKSKLPLWWLSKALIYLRNTMSPGVIFLAWILCILCMLSISVTCWDLGPWPI